MVVAVKALACALPAELGLPFSRLSCADLARAAVGQGLVASISGTTVWRWLSAEAIKPWSYRSWVSPRDPCFAERAGRVLDLYQGHWEGEPLGDDDYVLCADEKTQIQALRRTAAGPVAPGRTRRVESDYSREGTLAYLAAWDVRRARVFGLCEAKTGIEPFHHLVDLVMRQAPYCAARRVFWITDNGSSHRGQRSAERLASWYIQATEVHTPVHASWLNQMEIYFSVVQRKVLMPNEFHDLVALRSCLLDFQDYYGKIAQPFEWRFTRDDLHRLLQRLGLYEPQPPRQAA